MKNRIEQVAYELGYRVDKKGNLYNPKGKLIGGYIATTGYCRTNTRFLGKFKHLLTHRLQAYQKYGEKMYEEGICVRHFNDIKTDNSWDNILIGTQSENQQDIIRLRGTSKLYPKVKQNVKNIKYKNRNEIMEYYEKHRSYKKTMEKFNIKSSSTLHHIINKRII